MNSENLSKGKLIMSLLGATAISFTITIICWSLFELLPDWSQVGTISKIEAVRDIWVSLGACFTISILAFVCFSDKFATKASMLARTLIFSLLGYATLLAWVFGSGWCPFKGLGLFTIICVIAFTISGIITYFCTKSANKKLNAKLEDYKSN